jgi:hypothetical protein
MVKLKVWTEQKSKAQLACNDIEEFDSSNNKG